MKRLAHSAACAIGTAIPAFAQTSPADLAFSVAVVEWTAANCPAGSVPPQAMMISGLASAMGGEALLPSARADLDARIAAGDRPVEEVCATFARAIGQMVGEAVTGQ